MAPNAVIYSVDVSLSDMDRDVHEDFNIRAALHPSESVEYFLTRIMAYCLEYIDGITFSKGISDGDAPAIWAHDPTGQLTAWIEVGAPDAARLHAARKRAPHVAVYTHRNPHPLLDLLAGQRIHRAETIPIYTFERQFIDELAALLDRRMTWSLMVTEHQVYLNIGASTLTGTVGVHHLAEA
jgi:uncharacterized protein YaeQ